MTPQIVRYVCYDGSSKHSGGGQAYISQRHLGSDIINLAETSIFVGRNVHILWPKRPHFVAETSTFCGRNVHEIRDVSGKKHGRNGSWPKRPVTLRSYTRCHGLRVYPVCVCIRFACVIRSGYLVLANQHTSSEGQGSRDLRQTRVEPY